VRALIIGIDVNVEPFDAETIKLKNVAMAALGAPFNGPGYAFGTNPAFKTFFDNVISRDKNIYSLNIVPDGAERAHQAMRRARYGILAISDAKISKNKGENRGAAALFGHVEFLALEIAQSRGRLLRALGEQPEDMITGSAGVG